MRTLFLLGRLHRSSCFLAHRCAWCNTWSGPYDRVLAAIGFLISHTLCDECRAVHFPESK